MESKNPTLEDQHKMQLLFSKLRSPIHFSYIAQYILRESQDSTLELLNTMVGMGIIEESHYAKGYYVNASGPSGPHSLSSFPTGIVR